jgi:hypothetical protein
MTLMTLILSSIVLTSVGLKGESGMIAALLSAVLFAQLFLWLVDLLLILKLVTGLDQHHANRSNGNFLGVLVSALTVGFVIMILNETYGFVPVKDLLLHHRQMRWQQLFSRLMDQQPAPWISLHSWSNLSFSINNDKSSSSSHLHLECIFRLNLNTPLLVGGLIAHFVSTRSKDEKVNNARRERGTLIASGFIAGGALMGVISAILKMAGI